MTRGVRIFGIDPGSVRTGYGCLETDGSHHRLLLNGVIATPAFASFPEKLLKVYETLTAILQDCRPDAVAIENVFHSVNARSALTLGHARGVAVLAAVQAGLQVSEYTPTQIKMAVVGYGRADKQQVQKMVTVLLGLASVPSPHDAADALAVAVCHAHSLGRPRTTVRGAKALTSWRHFKPARS